MIAGGGKMVVDAADRQFGAGHFGRWIEDEGVEKMSFHWEADLDRGGRSVLAIRPLLWVDEWPVAGEPFKDGVYEISSVRRGYALELAVDFVRHDIPRSRFWMIDPNEPVVSYPNQTLDEVIATWPEGEVAARCGDWMNRPHQRWTIIAVPEAGGYLGGQYYKICIEGTDRVLAATEGAEVVTVPEFSGAPEQLWRIEQLTDGTYRVMPKVVPGASRQYVLTSVADSTPSLAEYVPASDSCKWVFRRK
jgi:arabinan endo-1,5-alpha-L-arabinosidase